MSVHRESRPSSRTAAARAAALGLGLLLAWPGGASAQATLDLGAEAGDVDLAAIRTPEQVVERIASLLVDHYVFEDKARACAERLRAALASGAFDDCAEPRDMAPVLTELLQEVTADKHLRVHVAPPGARAVRAAREEPDTPPTEEELAARRARLYEHGRRGNFGFEQVLRVDDNVGVLDLRGFSDPEVAHDTAVGAMQFLGTCDAIVFDLRQNGGGHPAMVQLIQSYLFDEPTHLNSLYWRKGDETEEFWTHAVPGRVMGDVPVVVLTSHYTFSAAEEFTYNLKTRGRATIVGETTGGGAHPGDIHPVSEQLDVFVPGGRAINPVTGTNWEGTGIEPDVPADAASAFDVGLRLAAEQARAYRDRRALESTARGR